METKDIDILAEVLVKGTVENAKNLDSQETNSVLPDDSLFWRDCAVLSPSVREDASPIVLV